MKFKIAALLLIAILLTLMTWQCFTWPVVEMPSRWVDDSKDIEAEIAAFVPVERPPSGAEVLFRCLACVGSLLLGVSFVRALRMSGRPPKNTEPRKESG